MGGAEGSQGGRCGEVECSVAFISTSTIVWKFLRFTAGAAALRQGLHEAAPSCWSPLSISPFGSRGGCWTGPWSAPCAALSFLCERNPKSPL